MTDSETTATLATQTSDSALDGQPVVRVERDGVEFVLLGTAHVSPTSVAAVEAMLEREQFDAVAVELCDSRASAMRDPEAFKRMDLFRVIREGKTGMVAASLVLTSYQKRLAEQFGIEPGAEMKAAMQGAEQLGLPMWPIDREIGVTLKRCWRGIGLREKFGLLAGLMASVFEREEISEAEIEKLKQGDMMESAFAEFAEHSESLYQRLISERDTFMAAGLREQAGNWPQASAAPRKVLAVVGAGHLAGLTKKLKEQQESPRTLRKELAEVPPAARWPKWLMAGILVAIFVGIGIAFHRDAALGVDALRDWVLWTGGLAALGALLSAAHPLSILAAFVAAPLKPFRPGIPAGAVAALCECWLRRPTVGDFDSLRDDLMRLGGWWRNRVARTLLIFMLVNIGTIAGEYLAGLSILQRLV